MRKIYGVDLRVLTATITGFFIGLFVHQKTISRALLAEETLQVAESVFQSSAVLISITLIIAVAWIISSFEG